MTSDVARQTRRRTVFAALYVAASFVFATAMQLVTKGGF
jgi:hypothetical protein